MGGLHRMARAVGGGLPAPHPGRAQVHLLRGPAGPLRVRRVRLRAERDARDRPRAVRPAAGPRAAGRARGDAGPRRQPARADHLADRPHGRRGHRFGLPAGLRLGRAVLDAPHRHLLPLPGRDGRLPEEGGPQPRARVRQQLRRLRRRAGPAGAHRPRHGERAARAQAPVAQRRVPPAPHRAQPVPLREHHRPAAQLRAAAGRAHTGRAAGGGRRRQRQPGDGGRPGRHRQGGGLRGDGAALRGVRHRQDVLRPAHTRGRRPPRRAVRGGGHDGRRGQREPGAVQPLRPRARGLHRRGRGEAGPLRARRRRHHLPGRDRRRLPGGAGQAAARHRDEGIPHAGRPGRHPCGRAHRRRHQPRPGGAWCARAASARTSSTG